MTDDELMRALFADHEAGLLASKLLLSTDPNVASAERIEDELHTLSRMIDAKPHDIALCAAYRALMWVRAPDAFSPPSEPL